MVKHVFWSHFATFSQTAWSSVWKSRQLTGKSLYTSNKNSCLPYLPTPTLSSAYFPAIPVHHERPLLLKGDDQTTLHRVSLQAGPAKEQGGTPPWQNGLRPWNDLCQFAGRNPHPNLLVFLRSGSLHLLSTFLSHFADGAQGVSLPCLSWLISRFGLLCLPCSLRLRIAKTVGSIRIFLESLFISIASSMSESHSLAGLSTKLCSSSLVMRTNPSWSSLWMHRGDRRWNLSRHSSSNCRAVGSTASLHHWPICEANVP